jgi:hypothetical protein
MENICWHRMHSILRAGRFVVPRKQVVRPHVFGCWTEIPDFEHRRRDALAPPRGAPSGPAKTHLDIRNDILIVRNPVVADVVTHLITRDEFVFPI